MTYRSLWSSAASALARAIRAMLVVGVILGATQLYPGSVDRALYCLFYPIVLVHGRKLDANGKIHREALLSNSSGPYYIAEIRLFGDWLEE
jgi:hypothetical protein